VAINIGDQQTVPIRIGQVQIFPDLVLTSPDKGRKLLGTVEEIEGLDEAARNRLRFATKGFVDAMSPANFMATNPDVMKRTVETKGENLLAGLRNMLADISKGQVTQSPEGAFELGRESGGPGGQLVGEEGEVDRAHGSNVRRRCARVPRAVEKFRPGSTGRDRSRRTPRTEARARCTHGGHAR